MTNKNLSFALVLSVSLSMSSGVQVNVQPLKQFFRDEHHQTPVPLEVALKKKQNQMYFTNNLTQH